MRRETVISLNSVSSTWSQSAKVMLTSAMFIAGRASVPLKRTSSIFAPRSAVGRCSPSTQRMASETLLLPQPLGPTMAISPGSKWSFVRSAKLLNPVISKDLRCTWGNLSRPPRWRSACRVVKMVIQPEPGGGVKLAFY